MIVGTGLKIRGETRIILDKNSNLTDGDRLMTQVYSDPVAFAQLYRRHYDAVFRYCVHRLFDRQIAEDVASAVFLKVVENFSRFKGTERQFRNWLYKIATNAVNSHLRSAHRRSELSKAAWWQTNGEVIDCEAPTDEADKKLAVLRDAVFTLKPRYQTEVLNE